MIFLLNNSYIIVFNIGHYDLIHELKNTDI